MRHKNKGSVSVFAPRETVFFWGNVNRANQVLWINLLRDKVRSQPKRHMVNVFGVLSSYGDYNDLVLNQSEADIKEF